MDSQRCRVSGEALGLLLRAAAVSVSLVAVAPADRFSCRLTHQRCCNMVPAVETKMLPTASTCFNILKIPAYSTKRLLTNKLLTAIRHGSQGFTFS